MRPIPHPAGLIGGLGMLALAGAAPPAWASAPPRQALVVASHLPGPGQQPLQYAGQDAARFADVLVELGGFAPEQVTVLVDPSLSVLRAALTDASATLAGADADGMFVFYYSGHARSAGLDLGGEQLPLSELRAGLDAVPAKVTLAVLDACQAGALSTGKGVTPTADFSYNTVTGLDTAGLAVVASSTETELSQESPELRGGVFTHHWVTGLRGAADRNLDGAVSLTEAYDYTYSRTLLSTAGTAIGGQHATLQTDLRGQGELLLTRPAAASARLSFSSTLDATVLLEHLDSGTVAAEVVKRPGAGFSLALAPGEYAALVRSDGRTERCTLTLGERETLRFELAECESVVVADAAGKGGASDPRQDTGWFGGTAAERLVGEVGAGALSNTEDAYVSRLYDFGYEDQLEFWQGITAQASAHLGVHRFFGVALTVGTLDERSFHREMAADASTDETLRHRFSWQSRRVGIYPRLQLPLWGARLVPYAQAGGGLAWSRSVYDDGETEIIERQAGPHMAGAVGVQLMPNFSGQRVMGLYIQQEAVQALVIENLLLERHDVGGRMLTVGVRLGK